MGKGNIESIGSLFERPADEPDPRPGITSAGQFPIGPLRVAVATSAESQNARLRYGGGEPTVRSCSHRRQQDRVLDAQQFCERRLHFDPPWTARWYWASSAGSVIEPW